MALDNKFRVSELAQSGSRAIISEDPISKTHTFIDGSTTIVSQSATEPYEHIEGERDGELTNYIEKPKYDETQLKKAVDTVIDELIVPPPPPSPPVVPKPVYDDLLERYNQAIADLAEANNTIRQLQAQIAQLQGQIQSLLSQLDAAQVARAIAENQLQQQASAFGELTGKFSQAIIKGTKEASARVSLQAQVEGLTAQKDTLREQILQLRQIVASLQGQVAAQLDILDTQQDAARQREEDAKQQLEDLKKQSEEALEAAETTNLVELIDDYGPGTYDNNKNEVGWFINNKKNPNIFNSDKRGPLFFHDRKDNPKAWVNGGNIYWRNLTDSPMTVSIDYDYNKSGDVQNGPNSSGFPFQLNGRDPKGQSFTIPAATGTAPNKQPGEFTLVLTGGGDHTSGGSGISNKNCDKWGKMKFRTPGKTFEIKYGFKQERRANQFDANTKQ